MGMIDWEIVGKGEHKSYCGYVNGKMFCRFAKWLDFKSQSSYVLQIRYVDCLGKESFCSLDLALPTVARAKEVAESIIQRIC